MTDPRVRHFWDQQKVVGNWFSANVTRNPGTTWDFYALYGADAVDLAKPTSMGGTIISRGTQLRTMGEPVIRCAGCPAHLTQARPRTPLPIAWRRQKRLRARDKIDGMRASLVVAFAAARAVGDRRVMVAAALALPTSQRFGLHPGQMPALLHEAYAMADTPIARARLAAALAWAYRYDAVTFDSRRRACASCPSTASSRSRRGNVPVD
jgi:hypothetical protein